MGFFTDALGIDMGDSARQDARDQYKAQQAAYNNLTQAQGGWQDYMNYLDTLEAPYSEGVINQMTTQQRDIAGANAAYQMDQARKLSGASGLGGGALANRERMINAELARRNAASASNIRANAALANNQFAQSLAGARGSALSAQTSLLANAPVDLTQPFGGAKRV